jgi:hypothetical protein
VKPWHRRRVICTILLYFNLLIKIFSIKIERPVFGQKILLFGIFFPLDLLSGSELSQYLY